MGRTKELDSAMAGNESGDSTYDQIKVIYSCICLVLKISPVFAEDLEAMGFSGMGIGFGVEQM